jgi:phage gp36-like protein
MWITNDDLKAQIKLDLLDKITNQDTYILPTVEAIAITEVSAYLSSKYDTVQVFATVGTARNPLLCMLVIDILLYHLHSRLNPNQVPDIRKVRYDEAKKMLEDVAEGKLSLALPTRLDENEKPTSKLKWGSETKRRW